MDRTACQTGMIAQNRIQRGLILTNKRTGTIVLMPVRAKRKEFPGGYDKNARFSVKMVIVLGTPPSYELEANASRSKAGFFCGSAKKIAARIALRIHPATSVALAALAQPAMSHQTLQAPTWKGEQLRRSDDPIPLPSSVGPFS